MSQPLPTDAIDLERQPEPEADHTDVDDLAQIWQALKFEEKTAIRDHAIIAVLSHGGYAKNPIYNCNNIDPKWIL